MTRLHDEHSQMSNLPCSARLYLVDAVKRRDDAVDDREASIGQHGRVEASRLHGGLGSDSGSHDCAVLHHPHCLADLGGAKARGQACRDA